MVNIKGLINAGLIKLSNIAVALDLIKDENKDIKHDRFIETVHQFIKGVSKYNEKLPKKEENSYVSIFLSPQVKFPLF